MLENDYNQWKPPIPIPTRELEPWPQGVFPGPFERFVEELSRSTETAIELSALMMLSTVATAVQRKFIVQVKPDYYEPVNIWTCVALPPGSRKSAVQLACVEPLNVWERCRNDEINPIRQKQESKNKTLEQRIKELRQKAAKQSEGMIEPILDEITLLEKEMVVPPIIPQLWTSDITAENLAVLMKENNECMAILSDEAGIFDTLAGRYSGGVVNLDLVLKGHSGTPTRVNRNNRPPLLIDRPTLTIGLSPQPHILEGIAARSDFRGRGLLGRFLYSIPPSNLGSRDLNAAPMDSHICDAYKTSISKLLSICEEEKFNNGVSDRLTLMLSQEAYDEWRYYALAVEIRMADEGVYSHIRDWAGKFPGAIARIAGLIHIMKSLEDDTTSEIIQVDTVSQAIRIGGCLQSHALAVFDLMGEDPAMEGARRILKWIKNNHQYQFTQRDCHYQNKSFFKKVDSVKESLKLLEKMDYLRKKEGVKPAHRPSTVYQVNPFVFDVE